ncbi:MAG: dienelactone hydrolase [Bradyrhizobium sp.]|uniref:alpha/beta hydrolase family protein n=1 Tax=Bradyrhizobium sp. TaxID=376 RepID=UPI001DED03AB|nr:dienelactone hydrolase [Bradyrhizobium sp.]MBV9559946.1 dienelactone hydrolase [Bradyrhizobium sp.]
MKRGGLLLGLIAAGAAALCRPAAAEAFHREDLHIAMTAAGDKGLEALLIRPDDSARHPLALISHGTESDAQKRSDLTPYTFYRQAVEFARRGFAALVLLRRGYGESGGVYAEGRSCCEVETFLRSAQASIADLRTAIAAMERRPDVTTRGMIAVGVSSGGLATLALTADPPRGLAGAINFAGGIRRSNASPDDAREADDQAALVQTFKSFGEKSRVPTLWIYAANDSYFGPELARRLFAAFTAGGGRAQLIEAPAFGNDGHHLFADGIPRWTAPVDDFLRSQKLESDNLLAAPAPPDLMPPVKLSASGRTAFEEFLTRGPHKAFAVSPHGGYGYWTARRSVEDAKQRALSACAAHAPDCTLYAIDDALAASGSEGHSDGR